MPRASLVLFAALSCVLACQSSSDPPREPGQPTAQISEPPQEPEPPNEPAAEPLAEPESPTDSEAEPELDLDPEPLVIDPDSNAKPADPPTAFKPTSTPFGGQVWGFPQASSANGRIVLIRDFGPKEPNEFGHHGPGASSAGLVAHCLHTKDRKQVEYVSMDATRRYFLLIHDSSLLLVDSATGHWETLARADMADDGNRCMTPRQGRFSPLGGRVAWILEGARQLRVRELASGREWSVPSHGRIWVGWPADDHDGAIVAEIDRNSTDWPKQDTTCRCWWCNRFAHSVGYYGWDGPKFAIHQVARDGQRSSGEIDESSFARHDKTTHGCELVASGHSSKHEKLERGPWHWQAGE